MSFCKSIVIKLDGGFYGILSSHVRLFVCMSVFQFLGYEDCVVADV